MEFFTKQHSEESLAIYRTKGFDLSEHAALFYGC